MEDNHTRTEEEWEEYWAELWSEDPEVELTDEPLDQNAPHGRNSEAELDGKFWARLKAGVGLGGR